MRKLITHLVVVLPLLALLFNIPKVNAQRLQGPMILQDFETLISDVIPSTTNPGSFDFDIYLKDTDPTQELVLAGYQAGIFVNPAIFPAGSIVSVAILNAGTATQCDLVPAQRPTAIQYDAAINTIKLAGRVLPGPGTPTGPDTWTVNGSVISTGGPTGWGSKIARIRVTCSQPLVPSSYGNFEFFSSTVIVPLYATRAALYDYTNATIVYNEDTEEYQWSVQPLIVQLPVTYGAVGEPGTNAHVYDNPMFNAACNNASAFNVTGTGSYCEGGAGLAAGLDGSQVGVNYTLMPGNVVVAGTGSAISFGNQLAGTYTVSGIGTLPFICELSVPMTGNAVITANTASTVEFTESACDSYTWALDGTTYTVSGDYTYIVECVTNILHLTITNTITPVVSIVASANPVVEGTSVTFTATAEVGTPMQFVWMVDGVPSGTNNFQFTYMPEDGDMVEVQMMVSETCFTSPTANSNIITIVINTAIPAAATWTGGANDNDWFTAGNWDVNAVPGAITNVTIPGGLGANYPMNAGVCNNLLIVTGASLMVNPTVGGTATVQSLVTAGQYHYISSPVENESAAGVFPLSTFLRYYDETQTTMQWINMLAADVLLEMTGYSVFIPGSTGDKLVSYDGNLNNVMYYNPYLSFTENSTVQYDGYNLMGNPFVSRIDLESGGIERYNVDDAFYFWNPAINDYSYWLNGAGVNGASQYVSVGQGFFVKVSTPGNGEFGITNEARTNAVQPFYKSTLNNVVRLKVEGDIYSDETMVLFNQQATSLFDSQFDAFKLKASEVNHMYTKTSDGSELAINTLTSIEQNTSIPVYFKVAHSGMYNITASELETIAGNIPVWLEDLKTGTVQNLRENAVYAFNANVNDNANRFKLTFAILGVDDKPLQNVNIWSVDKNIHMQLPVIVKGNVRVTNAAGQSLLNNEINAVGEYVIHAPVAAGIYMVTITSNEGTVTKKVFIK